MLQRAAERSREAYRGRQIFSRAGYEKNTVVRIDRYLGSTHTMGDEVERPRKDTCVRDVQFLHDAKFSWRRTEMFGICLELIKELPGS